MSPAETAPPRVPFGDRLAAAVAARESQVVLGLDPDPARLWPAAAGAAEEAERLGQALLAAEHAAAAATGGAPAGPAAGRAHLAAAVLVHARALIDAAGPACVAVKPQLACFERLGGPGWVVLGAVCAYAREQGLILLADGKRGDVPVSATVYARALFGDEADPAGGEGLQADAATVNPLMGRDALAPLVEGARAHGAGVFALVRTSNPGAADLLDLELAGGGALWERLAELVDELGEPGPDSGLADVGAVTGATAPEHLERMRALMPRTPFLLPGIGAQGGTVDALAPAFEPGKAAGLVSASRSIVDAHAEHGGTPPDAARAEAERLRARAWALA